MSHTMLHLGMPPQRQNVNVLTGKTLTFPVSIFLSIFQHFPDFNYDNLSINYRESTLLKLDDYLLQDAPLNSQNGLVPSSREAASSLTDTQNNLDNDLDIDSNPPLPTRQHHKRNQASKCREVLRKLHNLTFLVQGSKALATLKEELFATLKLLKLTKSGTI